MMFYVNHSRLYVATLFFYTRIYHPFLKFKHSLLSLPGFNLFFTTTATTNLQLIPPPPSSEFFSYDCATVANDETSHLLPPPPYFSTTDDDDFFPVKTTPSIAGEYRRDDQQQEEEKEVCSVCLDGFDEECTGGKTNKEKKVATKLKKCGHVFHMGCIDSWVQRDQFTCPLCRSVLLEHRRRRRW